MPTREPQGFGFQHDAQRIDLAYLLLVEADREHAAAGYVDDQTLFLELLHGFTDRSSTHLQIAGKLPFIKLFAGLIFPQ